MQRERERERDTHTHTLYHLFISGALGHARAHGDEHEQPGERVDEAGSAEGPDEIAITMLITFYTYHY